LVAACLCTALAAARAQAEQPLVTTVVEPCVPIDRSQLDRLLSIELGTSADTAGATTGATHVHVRCVAAGIELNLQDTLTRKGMVRVLSRESFQDASSTRLLALAIAEFVVASWVELRLPQKVQPAPVGPPPSASARRTAETAAAERVQPSEHTHDVDLTQIGLSFQLQLWSEQDDVMLGVGLRFLHAPVPSIAFSIAGDFAADEVEHALGTVLVRTGAVSIAGLGRIDLSPLVVLTGPGARLGFVQLAGSAHNADDASDYASSAPYGGVFWLARGELYVSDSLALTLDLELGAVTLPVTALALPDNPVFELDGAWFTTGIGLALEL
jgi:hypothetical protein